jgi:hypothetical protein
MGVASPTSGGEGRVTRSPGPGESKRRGTFDSVRGGKGGLTAFSGSSGWGRMNEASGLGMAGSLRVVARPDGQPARTPEEGGEAAWKPPRHFRSWSGPGPLGGGGAAGWGAPGILWENWGPGRGPGGGDATSRAGGRWREPDQT